MIVEDPRFEDVNRELAARRLWYVSPVHESWLYAFDPRFGVLDPAYVHDDDPAQPYLAFIDGQGQGARLRWPRCGYPSRSTGLLTVDLLDWGGRVEIRPLDVAAGLKLRIPEADGMMPGNPAHEEWFAQTFRGPV